MRGGWRCGWRGAAAGTWPRSATQRSQFSFPRSPWLTARGTRAHRPAARRAPPPPAAAVQAVQPRTRHGRRGTAASGEQQAPSTKRRAASGNQPTGAIVHDACPCPGPAPPRHSSASQRPRDTHGVMHVTHCQRAAETSACCIGELAARCRDMRCCDRAHNADAATDADPKRSAALGRWQEGAGRPAPLGRGERATHVR